MERVTDLEQGLRQGMRSLASGVCVISGLSEEGERCAMTASSVTSVSNEPPSLLVCVNKSARMDYVLANSSKFCVNVLSAAQQKISEVCATPETGEERFDVGSWSTHEGTGLYYVDHSPAVFVCDKQRAVEYGTHTIYIANIDEVLLGQAGQKALIYAQGGYHYL